MKPVAFDYASATDAPTAFMALKDHAGSARLMAGGQSLGPMLNLRLARPALIVDVSRTAALRGVTQTADAIIYGASITHAEVEDGIVPDATPGWMADVARHIAYRAIRNRGTLGGSLAHADPAADWVNVLTALDACVELKGPTGSRTLLLEHFFMGPFTTALALDEMIEAIVVPRRDATASWGYEKFCRKVGDFSQASAAVLIDPARGQTRVLLGAIEAAPILLNNAEALI